MATKTTPTDAVGSSTTTNEQVDVNTPSSSSENITITVEFTGGLELLFSNKKHHTVILPQYIPSSRPSNLKNIENHGEQKNQKVNITYLITHLVETLMTDSRREMFVLVEDGKVVIRPGILVLINDADWELEGEEKYELCEGDGVLFVSTLHGG